MSAQFEVPALPTQSQASDSSSSSDEDEPVEVNRRGKNYQFAVWQRFESKELFEQWFNDEKKNWVYQSRATNVSDMVETWFCRYASKYSNRLGYNCLARLRLLYPHHNNAVVVKRCENEHHHEIEANKLGLTEDQKKRARQLLEPCKHATMVMCSLEKTVEYPAQVTANEMTPNRKRKGHAGRDPLAPLQNRYAAL